MKVKLELILRDIAGEKYLIPIGEAAQKYNGMFVINSLGAFLWEMIPLVNTEEELVEKVLEQYEITLDEAKTDVNEFVSKLREMGIIE